MGKHSVLGLFEEADMAADAVDAIKAAGYAPEDYDILSGSPYPEGSFGEPHSKHRLYVFPFIGAILGLATALIITTGTQIAYPVVTGGKPILSIPPMAIIAYEGTLLGAILFTVIGVIFESRLPRLPMGVYDERITEGYIGVLVSCDEGAMGKVEEALRQAGAEDVKHS